MRWRWPVVGLLLCASLGLSSASWFTDRPLTSVAGLDRMVFLTPDFQGPPPLRLVAPDLSLAFLDSAPALPRRMMSVRWLGYWLVDRAGPIDIYAGADDLVRVWIDEQLVLERNPALGMNTTSVTLGLTSGIHRVRVDYAQYEGDMRLNLLWAPAGASPRAFAPGSLFRQPLRPSLARRASLAATLTELSRIGWFVTAAAVLVLGGGPLTLRSLRWIRGRGGLRRLGTVVIDGATHLTRTHGRRSAVIAGGLAVAWTAYVRWDGLNPRTLWADDVWVASLTRVVPIWHAMAVPAPAPPGFVGLLWVMSRLIPDPEIALQVVPFLCGLVGPVLLGLAATSITRSNALGLAALSLALLNPSLANYSIFVKQYSLDFVVAAVFLLLAIAMLKDRQERLGVAVGLGLGGAVLSLPSTFSSAVLVHLAALRTWWSRPARDRRVWPMLRWLFMFDVVLATTFFALLRARSGPELRQYWIRDFVPASSFGDAIAFLSTRGWHAIVEALPAAVAWGAPLAGVGLIWLLVARDWRWVGAFVALVFTALVTASVLQLYPIGEGSRSRIVIFAYAPTLLLVVSGVHAITRWLPLRSALNVAIAVWCLWLVGTAPAAARYPDLDHSDFVRQLSAQAQPADAIVMNGGGGYLAGYYGPWRPTAVANGSLQSFGIELDRPHTLTLKAGEDRADNLATLRGFLARERPARLWYFSTRSDTEPVEHLLNEHQCVEQARRSSNVSTVLIRYACPPGLYSAP